MDGFLVAETLRRESPEDFAALCETPIPFRVKDGDGFHYMKIPTICLDADSGELVEVHYNERTRAPVCWLTVDVCVCVRAHARLSPERL